MVSVPVSGFHPMPLVLTEEDTETMASEVCKTVNGIGTVGTHYLKAVFPSGKTAVLARGVVKIIIVEPRLESE